MIHIITGATGLVGSRLVYDLLEQNKKVRIITRAKKSINKLLNNLSYYSHEPEDLLQKLDIKIGNLDDLEFLLSVIEANSVVYHCAAMVSFNEKLHDEIINTNVGLTENLINACQQIKINKFCFVSSIASLGGKSNGLQIDENSQFLAAKKSSYSVSKYMSEMEVWKGMAEGLSSVIVNPAVILGPGDWSTGSSKIFDTVYKGLKFYTKGITGYVDVRDVTKAMIKLAESDITGERFLLSSISTSYQELFNSIAKGFNKKPPSIYANRYLTGLIYRFEGAFRFLFKHQPRLTKSTHYSSHSISQYNGEKISSTIDFSYTPIEETIKFVVEKYLQK